MLRNLIIVILAYLAYLIFKRFLSTRGRPGKNSPKQNGSAKTSKRQGQAVDAEFEDMDD